MSSPTPAHSPSSAPPTGQPRHRLGDVEEALRLAEDRIAPPTHSHLVHDALESLKHRLWHAHSHEHAVEDAAWADYRTRLDRGLSELEAEIRRIGATGEPSGEEKLADVLYRHACRMELDGWRLRLAASGEDVDREAVRRHIENAARGIDTLDATTPATEGEEPQAGDPQAGDPQAGDPRASDPRAEIDHSLHQLRSQPRTAAAPPGNTAH